MPWVPRYEDDFPSLGEHVVWQIERYMCHGEGDIQGQPARVDDEMFRHILECYRLDPLTGRRVYNEAVLSRPKGRAKSEVAAWICLVEGFGECRFSHWDDDGQPVARQVVSPLIKCLATEEGQAGNTFKTVAFIAGEWGPDHDDPEIRDWYLGSGGVRRYQAANVLYLPAGGDIRLCTSGAASKDGGLESHVVADETHLYVLPELRTMYATIARNLGKRFDADPWIHQTTTAHKPGELSTAEETMSLWRKGELSPAVYVNHRQAKGRVDIANTDHTKRQLIYVYGAASRRIDMDRKIRDMRDPRICKDAAEAARYFLNRAESGDDVWIPKIVVEELQRPRPVEAGEPICLGFDGSISGDTTVLRGVAMDDGYRFTIGMWEKPGGALGRGWKVPRREVMKKVRWTFGHYTIARGYFDPHEWRSDIEGLVDEFGDEVIFPWETHRDTAMHYALDRLHTDLLNGDTLSDDDSRALDHYGNAYVRMKGKLRLVRKEYPNSPRKIDTVVADALGYEARADAIADGWSNEPADTRVYVFR